MRSHAACIFERRNHYNGGMKRPAQILTGLLAILMIAICATQPGCARPILSADEDRSQFDRYDTLRAQGAPQFVEDEFGRRRPNLRGRLSPKD